MTVSSAALLTDTAHGVREPPFFDVEAWAASTALPGDHFDEAAAEHACAFFPRFLRHTKGVWAGKPFILEGWQRATVRTVFGWKRADGTRRFRTVYLEVARKNGKTALAAGIALYLAFASGEMGAEVYCAASNEDQALICFNEAKRMRAQSPVMRARTNAFKKNISSLEHFSKLEVLTAKSDTKDGLNVSGLIGDEFHAWKDPKLYDVLHTATGARSQPLEFYITTAGTDRQSICAMIRKRAMQVRDRVKPDHGFLPVIYAADKNDPIDDPKTWAKANPNLGISISREYLAAEAARAKELPRNLNAFKRLHLNIWTEQETLWIPRDKWEACNRRPVTFDLIRGRRGFFGLDLSAVTDLTALAGFFPWDNSLGGDLWLHCWMPKEGLAERVRNDGVPYDLWAEQGLISLTEGTVVDYDAVRAAISGVGGLPPAAWPGPVTEICNVVELARDRWNATQITTQLMGDGVTMVDFGQGFASMSAPSKELEKLVLAGELNHGGNELLAWMIDCTSITTDPAGNIKPVKPDRRETTSRIDGVVASIMGLGRAIAWRSEHPIMSLPKGYEVAIA